MPFLLLQLPVLMMMVVVVVGVRVLISRMEVPIWRPKGLWLRMLCPLVMSVDVRRRY